MLDLKRILIVVKRTKWERDVIRYGSERTTKKIYARQRHDGARIISSHDRQWQNLHTFRDQLKDARFIYRAELPFVDQREFDLLVSFGGDNHFVYVSHYAGQKPLMGINSDPETSRGALLLFDPDSAAAYLGKHSVDNVTTEAWSRISGQILHADGRRMQTGAATSEITVRSKFHDYVSRYQIGIDSKDWEEQKCSGLLLSTGAGSTGWYRNCHPFDMQTDAPFPKDSPFFRGIAREMSQTNRDRYRHAMAHISSGAELNVISEMDGEITVDADPERTFDFAPGSYAAFKLDANPLKIVVP